MDQLACMKAFIEIVERGSLHAAAVQLCQTDAAISKKLTKLEKSLHSQLLERAPGKQMLTEVGQHYYYLSKEALEKIYLADSFARQTQAQPKGELTILLSRYLFPDLIAPKLKAFMQRYPDLHLRFNTAERTFNFEKEQVDILFAIAMPPPNSQNLVRRKMHAYSTRNVICATPAYLAMHGEPKKPKDLLTHRYLCHVGQYPFQIIYFDKDQELIVAPFLKFDETQTIIAAAKQHLGFIAVREFKVSAELNSGEFVEVLAPYNQSQVTRYSYYRKQAYPDPKINAFLNYFN